MEGVGDITRVNSMISELRRHNLGMTSDAAYNQAQHMILGQPLTEESLPSPMEKEVRSLTLKVDGMTREMQQLQSQLASLNQQLQDTISRAATAQQAASQRFAQLAAAPQQPVLQPKKEAQQTITERQRPSDGFDPSVEAIFYCGNK